MTWVTPSTSMPRAATSVATRTFSLPSRNRRSAFSRDTCCMSPCSGLAAKPLSPAGPSAGAQDLLARARLPVHRTGRGGQYTYHGPGQRIAYVMLDLEKNGRDVRCHVWRLEEWMIRTLARFNVKGERRDRRIGVWIAGRDGHEDKIAAI